MGDILKFRPRRRGRLTLRKPRVRHGRRGFLAWWILLLAAFVLLIPGLVLKLFAPLADALPGNVRETAHDMIRNVSARVREHGGWIGTVSTQQPAARPSSKQRSMAHAGSVRGRAEVIDGDSLRLRGVEIRLHGIDAPEYRQTCRDSSGRAYACGRRAAARLRGLIRGREITCRRVATDRYGRMVARCTLPGGDDIGQRMVHDGWAVAFVRYSRAYVSDERAARAARRGMWRGRFIPPAAWRRAQRH